MLILGIETACDDTAVALVRDGHVVMSSVVITEAAAQREYGGIIPELAARAQLELIIPAVKRSFDEAGVDMTEVDAVAVNNRHGLLRSIVVGVATAKALSMALNVPLIPVHHIEGHLYSVLIEHPDIEWPHVCLTVAGGHNLLLHAQSRGQYELLGRTLDDAAGEAYDKLARRLGLGFPGGLQIDRLAADGDPTAFALPRPIIDDGTCDVSFSGLKTAVTHLIEGLERVDRPLPLADIAASFQEAVTDVLTHKALFAMRKIGASTLTVAGGVSANSGLRDKLAKAADRHGFKVVFPALRYCTDNAAMIACAGYYQELTQAVGIRDAVDAWSNYPLGDLGINYSRKKQRAWS